MRDEWNDLAVYYEELYVDPEQYQREAAKVSELIKTYQLSDGNNLLDLACGTGGHIPYWRGQYIVAGLDLSPSMLERAVRRFPDIEFHLGDMVDFTLKQSYDAIVCLYGSIGFVRTLDNLNKALANFTAHLKPGGILCLTPWSTQEEFKPEIVAAVVNRPDTHICRMENVKRKAPDLIEIDFHHLIGRDNTVQYHTQSFEIGLFSQQQYLDAIGRAGLELMEFHRDPDTPMGVFVARRKTTL